MSLATPASVQKLQAALHAKAKGEDARGRRRESFSESRMREIRPSGSMSDLLETEYGRASEAPPTERGGQRLCPTYPTAPDLDSTRQAKDTKNSGPAHHEKAATK